MDLLPIVLDQDLRIYIATRRLLDTTCHFAGDASQVFKSLNDAAQTTLQLWTDQEKAAINVFKGVKFVHDHTLLVLDNKRGELLDGRPLPQIKPMMDVELFDDQPPA